MSLLAATLLLGQVTGLAPRLESSELTMSDRTEARARQVPSANPAYDVTTSVASAISVSAPRVSYSVGYGLIFTAVDLEHGPDAALMQTGRVGVSYSRHRLSLTLAVAGTYGTQVALGVSAPVRLDLPGPGVGTPAGTQPAAPGAAIPTYVPPTQEIKFGSLGANASIGYDFARRWTFSLNGGGLVSGGIDFLSQRVSPPSRSVAGGVGLGYKLTRRDQLTTRLSSSYIYAVPLPHLQSAKLPGLPNPSGGWFVPIDVFETWVHGLSKRAATSLGAGASFVHSETSGQQATNGVFATGSAAISYAEPLHDRATLGVAGTVAVSTTYNPVVGAVQHQGSVSASASWSWRKLSAGALAGAASELPVYARYSSRVATGSVVLGYAPADAIQLQAGARGNTQILYDRYLGLAPPPDWAVFFAVLLVAPRLRL